ncbi:MAG: OsmC family protein [Bdellovibrio sp.]|nr:OsmC family protein [Bdellovibrio sp.]
MHKLPLEFSSQASATGDFEKTWPITSGSIQAICSIPTEFGGAGGGFSPEDLFLQALMNCFIGTFKVYAKASRITFSQLNIKGQLTVDQNDSKSMCMKKALLSIEVHGVDRPDRIETIVAKTLRDGFILNSVKTEIQHELIIHAAVPS